MECAARRDGLALCEASEPLPFGDARRPRAAESITGCWCAPGDGPEETRRGYGADPERLSDDATAPLPDQDDTCNNTNPSLYKAVHGEARDTKNAQRTRRTADVANLQTEAEAMKEEIQQLRARAQQETLEREHAAVGVATAEVSRLRTSSTRSSPSGTRNYGARSASARSCAATATARRPRSTRSSSESPTQTRGATPRRLARWRPSA